MKDELGAFEKRHDHLICVDSDGCAINNLEAKHRLCFAPCLIREWKLEKWRKDVTALWMQINVYDMTRGIPRFQALLMALEKIHGRYQPIRGLAALRHWTENAEQLTEAALAEEAERTHALCLKKALRWCRCVNEEVQKLTPDDCRFFDGVDQGLLEARRFADIAVVSSANREAVLSEWKNAGLNDRADVFLCQEVGSKAYCIAQLKKKGYHESNMLMVGDSPSDRASAELNGVCFYPILARRESASWQAFPQAARQFCQGGYRTLEKRLSEEFILNLSGGQQYD